MIKKLTELEIFTYLKDYTMFVSYIITNPTEKFDHLFTKMLNDYNRTQFNELDYYYDMLNVSEFYILNKYYSFLKDIFFDYLLDKNIDDMSIPNTIFINPNDSKSFSKKQIINYIRNALNHSNFNKLYTLSKEEKNLYIEINLSKTKPIPFHIKMTIKEYTEIMSQIIKANRMDFKEFVVEKPIDMKHENLFNELDNIIFRQYIPKCKLEDTTMNSLRILQKDNKIKDLREILKKENVSITENKLNFLQKNCVIEEIEKWQNLLYIKEETILKYALYKVIPSGKYKLEGLSYLLIINDVYLRDYTNSYNDVIYAMLINKNKYNNHFYDFFKNSENNHLLIRDLDNLMQMTIMILVSYIFENLITEEQVKIGNNFYETERIRNSFVHGKWFLGQNGSYKLFDNPPSNLDELNYTWKSSIPFKNIITFMEEFYKDFYEKNIEKAENKFFMDIPAYETYSKTEPYLPSYLTFVKKQTKFIFNLNINDYNNKDYIPWNLYKVVANDLVEVTDEIEQQYFYEELEQTKIFSRNIIELIKEKYQKLLKYRKNLITLEDLSAEDDKFIKMINNNPNIKLLKKTQ